MSHGMWAEVSRVSEGQLNFVERCRASAVLRPTDRPDQRLLLYLRHAACAEGRLVRIPLSSYQIPAPS